MEKSSKIQTTKKPNLFALLKPYRFQVFLLLFLAVSSNALNLALPKVMSHGIDALGKGQFVASTFVLLFGGIVFAAFCVAYGQVVAQVMVSERVARDMRARLSEKISRQTFSFVQQVSPSKLLTNLTSDIDAVKVFVSQALVSIVSSIVLIIGASTLLLITNWKLGLATLVILPVIAVTFFTIFSKVGGLFKLAQGVVDRLNKVINESILGAALIRVLNAQAPEYDKFLKVNAEAQGIGYSILRLFASVVPIITFLSSIATVIVLAFGGHLVIQGQMTLGQLASFNSYLSMLIFPIFIIGFMSNAIARSAASYGRVLEVLDAPDTEDVGTVIADITGQLTVSNVNLSYADVAVLKDISFQIQPKTRNAIIGPTAAGKTQLMQIFTGLTKPNSGQIAYDGVKIGDFDKKSLHSQVGFVFQDSILFRASLRENIAFSQDVSSEEFDRAVATAELDDFIHALPEGMETMVSERGNSLSGGQKQRVMLARALTLHPKVLFLDDFTARVDIQTEKRILENVRKNYPHLTLVSVTQKVASIEDYDQIILLMEGEILAAGTHAELMEKSPEYVQIAESQKTTTEYDKTTN
ncbi:ABC transporter ATP-binding protein [Candidatus Uhrbacteria bacterium]|nr:ABC transporter ATP-binding protein [Candidatus Uhrbacteria bacterium]